MFSVRFVVIDVVFVVLVVFETEKNNNTETWYLYVFESISAKAPNRKLFKCTYQLLCTCINEIGIN